MANGGRGWFHRRKPRPDPVAPSSEPEPTRIEAYEAQRAEGRNPDIATPSYQTAERRRDFDGALAEYRHALEAQPTFRLARFNLGRMLLVKGDSQQAIAAFEALREPVDAETPRYLFALSTALVRAGKVADGRRVGEEARQLAVEFGQADFARAIGAELAKLK